MALPRFLQPYLWSYDIAELDLQEHKNLIITQVLNYGSLRAVRWLFKKYSEEEIKEVLKHPRRGVWERRSLNYWSKILDVEINLEEFEFAVRDLNPRPKLYERYFRNK